MGKKRKEKRSRKRKGNKQANKGKDIKASQFKAYERITIQSQMTVLHLGRTRVYTSVEIGYKYLKWGDLTQTVTVARISNA